MSDIDLRVTIAKADEEQRILFGWANVTELDGTLLVDKQDQQIETAELESAVYDFMADYQVVGNMHKVFKGVARIVESFMVTTEKLASMFPEAAPVAKSAKAGWWVGVKVDDDQVWEDYKAGKIAGFSIGGTAQLEEVPAE